MIAFTIPGPPVPKGRPRIGKFGHAFTPFATRAYEKHAKSCASLAMRIGGKDRLEGPVGAVARFLVPDRRRRDSDNLSKAITDACNQIIYADDSQISRMLITRDLDRDNPRAEFEAMTESAFDLLPFGGRGYVLDQLRGAWADLTGAQIAALMEAA